MRLRYRSVYYVNTILFTYFCEQVEYRIVFSIHGAAVAFSSVFLTL